MAISMSEGTFSLISNGRRVTLIARVCSHRRSADLRVLCMSMATVIGPTPPGTGVMWEAVCEAEVNSTSPTKRCPDFFVGSRGKLVFEGIVGKPMHLECNSYQHR